MTARGLRNNGIASPDWFMKVWRGIGWIKIRTPMGAFTHCGLCDYLKMVSSTTLDAALKEATLGRLVDHWKFQAAQRVAMDVIFERSVQNPFDLMAVAWDKMDQIKTMIPRIKGLANTGFYKQGPRLVVSLFGAHCPAMSPNPLFYTLFEDYTHGSNMVASVMVDVLMQMKPKLKHIA